MRRFRRLLSLNALTITILYLIVGITWIIFSDQILKATVQDIQLFTLLESIKGIIYVLVTAVFLYFLIQHNSRLLLDERQAVSKALQSVKIATWSVNLIDGVIVTSPNHYSLFGKQEQPFKWNLDKFFGTIHPEDREKVKKTFKAAVQDEKEYLAEFRVVHPDDSIHWLQSRGNLIYSSDGKPSHIAGIVADITAQKNLESNYAQEKELFERIFEKIPVMVNVYDPEVNNIRANNAFEEHLGWSNEDMKHIDFMELCYPDEGERKKAQEVMTKADGEWHEFEVRDKYGNTHIQEWANIRLSDDKIVGIGLDVTELRSSQRSIEKSQQLLSKTFESLKESVVILDPGTRLITNVNNSTCEIFGYSREELIGHTTEKLHISKQKFKEFGELGLKDLEENGVFQTQYKLRRKDGSHFHSDHTVTLVKNNEGEVEKVVSVIRDITENKKQEEQLKQHNEFVNTTLENLPIGVAVNLMDTGEVTLMNKRFSDIYGWSQDTLINTEEFFKAVYPETAFRERMIQQITKDIESGDPERMQWNGVTITTQSGEERIIDAKNISVPSQNLMISTVVDVTARVRAEQKLADSEKNYRSIFQQSPLPMWIYDPDTYEFVEVNNAAIKHYGYTRLEFSKMSIYDIRPKKDHQRLKNILSEIRLKGSSETEEWRHTKKSGEIIHVRVTGTGIKYFGRDYRLVLINDVTAQKKAEESVLASIVEGENKERTRIARELHDGLGQYLAAANMNLNSVKEDLHELTEQKRQSFQKGLDLLKHAVSETAQISRNLMPRVVEDYGLALAIESLVESYQSHRMTITYFQNISDMELPREVALNLYRIAQEGISNAVKYSKATELNVQLIHDNQELILTIEDNGVGIEQSKENYEPGLGLRTISSRVGALGGDLEFDSKPNKGTLLNIVIPLV